MKATRIDMDGTVLLTLRGDFDSFVVDEFLDHIDALCDEGVERIILNMRRVRFVNSSALGALIKARRTLQRLGGELAISAPSAAFTDAVNVLGLGRQFLVQEDDELALDAVA